MMVMCLRNSSCSYFLLSSVEVSAFFQQNIHVLSVSIIYNTRHEKSALVFNNFKPDCKNCAIQIHTLLAFEQSVTQCHKI